MNEKIHVYCKNLEPKKQNKHLRDCRVCHEFFRASGKFCKVCDNCNPKEWMKSKVLYI